jgi:hypothetical protein
VGALYVGALYVGALYVGAFLDGCVFSGRPFWWVLGWVRFWVGRGFSRAVQPTLENGASAPEGRPPELRYFNPSTTYKYDSVRETSNM